MIVKTLKETLNGGFAGLFGEVVTEDCYRLRQIDWDPALIFDLGGNVGVFARYARSLFPRAKIVSVEPNPENCEHFRKFTADTNTTLIEAAIGKGDIWHVTGARNGAMEVYLSEGLGYPRASIAELDELGEIEKIRMPTIMPADLVDAYWKPGMRTVMKIDIEGGENAIFMDEDSVECMKEMDYLVMEIHYFAHTGREMPEVRQKTVEVLTALEDTHVCELQGPNFWAVKKQYNGRT